MITNCMTVLMPPLKWGTHDEGPWSSQCKCALSNQARDAKVFGQVRPLGRMFWDLRFGSSRGNVNVRSFRDPASFFGGGTDLLGSKKTAFNLSSSSAGTNVQGYEVLGVQGWSSFRRWIPERGGGNLLQRDAQKMWYLDLVDSWEKLFFARCMGPRSFGCVENVFSFFSDVWDLDQELKLGQFLQEELEVMSK